MTVDETKVGLLNGARLNYYIGRVVTVLYSLAALGSGLALVIADADLTTSVGAVGSLVVVVPLLIKFLEGVQQNEKAGYAFNLQTQQANAQLSIIAAEEEAAAKIGGAQRSPRIATR